MPTRPAGSKPWNITRYSDVAMAVAVLGIVGLLIVPMPAWLLDFCLAINLTVSIVIVLITLYATEPLQFSVFPSLLLVITLFRLALNVAATKLILATGQAGHIIDAFGNVVVQGNFVVGVIAFLILVVIQFVVITNGAGRIAEVAARFTLDALPGKQMAIDSELAAGVLTEEEAKARRKKTEMEADFYGAMDGASKFVRGDAIAAVLIIIINIVGGFAIGLMNGQSDALTILRTYTLLTIGEGLVSQIPALLISTATGLMVTRVSSEGHMGQDLFGQLLARPRALMMAGCLMLMLMLVPGFPKAPIAIVGGFVVIAAAMLTREEKRVAVDVKEAAARAIVSAPRAIEDPKQLLNVEPLLLELGAGLVPLADTSDGGDLADRVAETRRDIARVLGIMLPTVRIRDNLQLPDGQYNFRIRDQLVASYDMIPKHVLAIDSGQVYEPVEGMETTEPAFGTPALWVPLSRKDRAQRAGYVVVDPASVLITHVTEVIKSHAYELLTRTEVQALLDNIKHHNKAVVEELVPALLTLGDVQKVLQNLLREKVSVRDLGTILEALADWAPRTKDVDQLTEYARAAISRQICKQHADETGGLPVITLDTELERTLRESIQVLPQGAVLAISPAIANSLFKGLSSEVERAGEQGYAPVVLCSTQIRLPLKRLTERTFPALSVMAYNEVVQNVEVRSIGSIAVDVPALSEVAA